MTSNYIIRSVATDLSGVRTILYSLKPDKGDKSLKTEPKQELQLKEQLGRFFVTDLSLGISENSRDIEFRDAVCSVNQSKQIVSTAVVGLSGTIKEYISAGDYDITLTVGIAKYDSEGNQQDEYPEEQLRKLIEILSHDEALYVHSDFLQMFGITKVVVQGYQLEQMTHSNIQIVRISLLSDEDYVIKNNEY